jgi:hypothetical protein
MAINTLLFDINNVDLSLLDKLWPLNEDGSDLDRATVDIMHQQYEQRCRGRTDKIIRASIDSYHSNSCFRNRRSYPYQRPLPGYSIKNNGSIRGVKFRG